MVQRLFRAFRALQSQPWLLEFVPDPWEVTPEPPDEIGAAMVVAVVSADWGTSSPTGGNFKHRRCPERDRTPERCHKKILGGGKQPGVPGSLRILPAAEEVLSILQPIPDVQLSEEER